VLDKRSKMNQLVIGSADDPLLFKIKIQVGSVNWIAGQAPKFPLKCEVRLRHRQLFQKAIIKNLKSKIIVEFEASQRAVTPGQFAVFYKDGKCLGGGEIL
jgi:tRNA-specific 2-thiouridylase